MYMFVYEPNAPNNAFSIKSFLFKHIGKVQIEFFHPKHPDPELRFEDGEPWRIGKLEADIDSAIELRDTLTRAIDELQSFRVKELEGAIRKAKTLDGQRLQSHCEAFVTEEK